MTRIGAPKTATRRSKGIRKSGYNPEKEKNISTSKIQLWEG